MELEETQEREEISEDFSYLVMAWLALDSPAERRRFVEQHLALLDSQSDHILAALEDSPALSVERTVLQDSLSILQDARKRGGDIQAVRAASINVSAGFVLDLPDWLNELLYEANVADDSAFQQEKLQETLAYAQKNLEYSMWRSRCGRLAMLLKRRL